LDSTNKQGQRFLHALFRPTDVTLFRFIETWSEDGKKRSRAVRHATAYGTLDQIDAGFWSRTGQLAEAERANQFFGVCPRFGDAGYYDLAWQVRMVRVLWSDLAAR